MAIGAHPDDVEFGCGGTLAKWAAAGCTVHHVVCTDGSKGTWDVAADTAALVARRREEQREAARRLAGDRAGEVVFLDEVDGELDSGLEMRGRVALAIRRLRPDVVLGHDPWKRYRLHPDHRHAGLLACEGIVAARDPHFYPEHGVPHHRPHHLLLWEADEPDHVEDVSDWVGHKLHALEAHESQFESTMKAVDDEQLAAFRVRITERLADLGRPHDLAAAEVFKLISRL
jgi:LmbE family N-acetylglucosaminyl deacetylase